MSLTTHSPAAVEPTTRAIVAALRGDRRVVVGRRRTALRLTYVPDVCNHPIRDHRLVFAIGRHVGNAVVRNRCRRRVRAAFRDVLGTRAVPDGGFLFRPTPEVAEMPFSALVVLIESLVIDLEAKLAREASA